VESQRYVVFVTAVADEHRRAEQVLWRCRIRWQNELALKRRKSVMDLGYLPKGDVASARAWLHDKLLAALLIQATVDEGRLSFPWGYVLGTT